MGRGRRVEGKGGEWEQERIKMYDVQVQITHDKCDHSVRQTYKQTLRSLFMTELETHRDELHKQAV